jgi:rare lipoprotein A
MTKTTRTLLRVGLFIVVLLGVLSISILVEARDLPASVQTRPVPPSASLDVDTVDFSDLSDGLASWYGREFHGRRTASGKRYDMHAMTAAHRTLPFGSLVRVVNPATGKTIVVEITDRGPFIRRRVIDLSAAAARALGVSVSPVEVEALTPAELDSLVDTDRAVAILPGGDVIRVASSTISVRHTAESFAAAVRLAGDADVVVVLQADTGIVYGVAEGSALQTLASTQETTTN